MNYSGLTSVTFRQRSIENIVMLVKESGLQAIEWGSDIHCPPGDIKKAKLIKALCDENDIKIITYGSYYTLLCEKNPLGEFKKVIESAKVLGASVIRIWAGNKSSGEISKEIRNQMVNEAKMLSDIAFASDITIGFEYHNNSLTDCSESALQLMKEIDKPNCRLYWQTDPNISFEENLKALTEIYDYILCVHVFSVTSEYIQKELSSKKEEWAAYYNVLKNKDIPFFIEFVKDEDIANFYKDAAILKDILRLNNTN